MTNQIQHHWPVKTRREFFTHAGSGLAGIALSSLFNPQASAAGTDPLAPKVLHHPAKAKSVIWLFMEGGPSHIDLFDPKPKINEMHGQPIPASMDV